MKRIFGALSILILAAVILPNFAIARGSGPGLDSAFIAASTAPKECPDAGCLDGASSLGIPNSTGKNVGETISGVAKGVVNILGILAGILSVVFLVIGGIRYSSSSGNPKQIESAKQTIMYAIIGLILSIIAPLIVGFVIARGPQ